MWVSLYAVRASFPLSVVQLTRIPGSRVSARHTCAVTPRDAGDILSMIGLTGQHRLAPANGVFKHELYSPQLDILSMKLPSH